LPGIGLFGTFVEQRADLPCRYGSVRPLRSNNPFVINAHEFAALARDLSGRRRAASGGTISSVRRAGRRTARNGRGKTCAVWLPRQNDRWTMSAA
jgi:hypothetical protein